MEEIGGWYFTGTCDTKKLVDEDGSPMRKAWTGMSHEELIDLQQKLFISGEYPAHVREIKRELVRRIPPTVKTIAEVTIKSKL